MREPKPIRVRITRYIDRRTGKRVKKGARGARRVRERTETYYAWIGGDRVSLGTADLGEAWAELRRQLRRARERAAGLSDDYLDHAAGPLTDHLADWLAALEATGLEPGPRGVLRAHLDTLADLAGWKRLSDLTPETCLAALAAVQTRLKLSPQTRNHYLAHAKQFARWCLHNRRLREHPLLGLKPVSTAGARRRDRRCLTADELAKLFAYLDGAPVRKRMTGAGRALMYKLAMSTGFRAKEIRSLTRASFDLDAATVTVEAAYSKHRRRDTQPLPAWLVAELRTWFGKGGECWRLPDRSAPGDALRADLAGAGVPYSVLGPSGQPLYADFHALRHTYITTLANLPGISPKTLMELARHSSPTLTLKIYAKARTADLHAAAAEIPDPGAPGIAKNIPKNIPRKKQGGAKKS